VEEFDGMIEAAAALPRLFFIIFILIYLYNHTVYLKHVNDMDFNQTSLFG
jgi:hypothetical protein